MAKSKSGGEGKIGLIIALAFFVITSIALGVFAYQFNSEIEGANNKAKDAKQDEQKTKDLLLAERKRVAMYKAFVGMPLSADEKTVLTNLTGADPLRAEHQDLMRQLASNMKTVAVAEKLDFDAENFIRWDWPADRGLPESPRSGTQANRLTTLPQEAVRLVSAAEKIRAQAEAAKAAATAAATAHNAAAKEYADAKDNLDKALKATVDEKAKVTEEGVKAKADAAKTYLDESAKFRVQLGNANTQKFQAETDRDALAKANQEKEEQLLAIRRREDAKKAVLPFDLPKGKIVSRRGNVVEINLGRADKLQTGVTFSVQPLDYQDKGEQARIRQLFDPKGLPVKDREGNAVKMFQPKGTIEIIEVLGPNLAKGQITGEYDTNREPIMEEDLIYNAAWNRGNSDHVVLVGIFDTDGNGADDIKQVARELAKAGVVVDGFWDLSTGKWALGAPTERTAYAIRGEYPLILPGALGEGLTKEKELLRTSLSGALAEAEKKGAKVISYRDYFPRVGYKFALGVPDDAINQASAKYLQSGMGGGNTVPPPDTMK